ncbi:MAG: N-acetylglucosamine-6-phosphate deacetylase [Bacteroidetes bacterium]|nr:N-acetylglucosamine-6-phosphate deacetylase [Bacteroidota bacterium]MCL6101026.1 N-acetylglucosamine-6-phosphate deacetylase [Bacteroidota bacterium]
MFSLKGIHYETMSPVRIDVSDGIIQNITALDRDESAGTLPIVAPGLIDNQVNGYAGVDFSGDQLSVADIVKATRSLWKSGVTSYLPTLITNSPENLIRNFRILASALSKKEVALSVPGFHLEGPYLSKLEGFRGCHREDQLTIPDLEQFVSFQKAAEGWIVQLTLAPELPGAIELIRFCKENRIIPAIGHSNANSKEIDEACDCGAKLSTHLGNGCANLIHRHQNPIWPQLANEQLIPTVIADGHHLLPEELKVFLKVKGADRLILTSDITYLAGMPAGRYYFGGADVILTEEGMLKSADQDCLAGASLPLLKGVENMIRFTGCTLAEAINMASKNVANVFEWHDRGRLLPGRRADILLLTQLGSNLNIQQCYLAGEPITPNS